MIIIIESTYSLALVSFEDIFLRDIEKTRSLFYTSV